MCSSCGRREIDMKPQWLKGTDTYYARAIWVCSTAECKTTKMNMIPVDKSINYIKHRHLIDRMREDMSRKEVIDRLSHCQTSGLDKVLASTSEMRVPSRYLVN